MRTSLLLVAALAALPQVQAQAEGSLVFEAPVLDKPALRPDVDVAKLELPVTFACGGAEAWPKDGVLVMESPAVDGEGVTGAATVPVPQSACTGAASAEWTAMLPFAVTASQRAPGETDVRVKLRGTVAAQGTAPARSASAEGVVRVAYLGLLSANAPDTIRPAPCSPTTWS